MDTPIAPLISPALPPEAGRQGLGRSILQLSKLRLSLLVVFSGVIAYVLGRDGEATWGQILLFVLAGLATTISANIVNQIIEIGPDTLMNRTKSRPLPTGAVSPATAWGLVVAFGVVGLGLYAFLFNGLSAGLAFASWVLYGFVYTPMKPRSPLAVAVGAVPGALPLLIGFAAATGTVGPEAFILFVIQFIWQFPHFWAIAWVLHEDYARGGFRLLPGARGEKDRLSAFLMLAYAILLIPAGWLPTLYGYVTAQAAIVSTLAGLAFAWLALDLYLHRDDKHARRVMFGSFIYLPIVQLAVLVDKLG